MQTGPTSGPPIYVYPYRGANRIEIQPPNYPNGTVKDTVRWTDGYRRLSRTRERSASRDADTVYSYTVQGSAT